MAAIGTAHFDGHKNIARESQVSGSGSPDLASILRNFVDEGDVHVQSGSDTLAAGTKAVTLPKAMPSASYEVAVTLTADPGVAAHTAFVTGKTTTGFTVTTKPAAAAETFDWVARNSTRLNSKG